MTSLLVILGAPLLFLTIHGFSLSATAADPDADDVMSAPAQPDPMRVRELMKRDLSLNQDLKSLANILLMNEHARIMANRRNREFLRKIGKRGMPADVDREQFSSAEPMEEVVMRLLAAQ